TSIANSVDTAMRGDWFVETTFGQGGLAPSVGESIASLPEVGAMSALRYSAAIVDGAAADVSAFDPAQIDVVADLAVTDGAVAGMGTDEVAIQTEVADEQGLGVGDRVAGFEVEGIAGTPADGVHVHLRRGEVRLVVSIVPRGAEPHAPPSQSAHYDLFFGHVRPERPDLEGHEVGAALGELSARVIANEGAGPPALQSFSSAAP
ncbi:MAG TPA: hypothetical protein PKW35_23425, partial [Nannocystaceae bacterium]|nr:hypothetical protein [Nannocystaceae bacterium]